MHFFQRWYDRILQWSAHRYASVYLAIVSFIEAIFFPIPPDVMLAPMCLSRPEKAWRYALICTVASMVGAVLAYFLGAWLGEWVRPWLESGHYAEAYAAVVDAFDRYGVAALLLAGFSPIPFKVFTVSSGLLQMAFIPFVLAATVARAARFFLVAGLIRWGGPKMEGHLRRWIDWIGWGVVVLALITFIVWRWVYE
ncbi:MAG: DedA family protein [Xanthomonadales bacterium]|nr:DedA family protein [Xanthomonadales bacterium]